MSTKSQSNSSSTEVTNVKKKDMSAKSETSKSTVKKQKKYRHLKFSNNSEDVKEILKDLDGKSCRWKRRRLHLQARQVLGSEPPKAVDEKINSNCNKTIFKETTNTSDVPDSNKKDKHKANTKPLSLPANSEDVSQNWKNIKKILEKERKNTNKQHTLSSGHPKRALHKSVKRKCSKTVDQKKKGDSASKSATKTVSEATPGKSQPERTGSNTVAQKIQESVSKSEPEIWFDGVDEILIEKSQPDQLKHADTLVKVDSFKGVTKIVAMDCEMVGIGPEGRESMLARVSIVNQHGHNIYDKYVKPQDKVVDYRTFVSGITPENLVDAEEFATVQTEVCNIIKGRMLVGHALRNDLKVLLLGHPRKQTRDTSSYRPFRELFGWRSPSLKKLTLARLGVQVQDGQHDSIQDAQAAMRLYTMHRQRWEKDIKLGLAVKKRDTTKVKHSRHKKKKMNKSVKSVKL